MENSIRKKRRKNQHYEIISSLWHMCIIKFNPLNKFVSTNPRVLLLLPFIHLTNMIVHFCMLDLILGPWEMAGNKECKSLTSRRFYSNWDGRH